MTRIIGDTTSGLTPEQAKEIGIDYIPQIVIFGDKSYRDDYEIDPVTFVKMLEASKELPKTAAPPPSLYTPIFEKLRENKEDALVLAPSVKVSGTYRSAMTAKNDFPDVDIRVIDTGVVGGPVAMELIEAKKMADQHRSLDEIENYINLLNKNVRFYAVVDTLEYLYKGGRIGGASKLFGDALQIKPILTLKDGQVEAFEKQRTQKKALSRIVDLVQGECPKGGNHGLISLSLNVNLCQEELSFFRKEFKERFGFENVPVFNAPPAFMVHAGPRVVLVSFFTI